MPDPISKYSTDKFFYDYLCKPLAQKICFIHPNVITIIGFLFTFPIIYNILYKGNYFVFVILVFTRYYLDCLDGSLARTCNKTSKLGSILDNVLDNISNVIIITFLWYIFRDSPVSIIFPFCIFIFTYICLFTFNNPDNKVNTIKSFSILAVFFHDNYILVNSIILILIKIICSKYI